MIWPYTVAVLACSAVAGGQLLAAALQDPKPADTCRVPIPSSEDSQWCGAALAEHLALLGSPLNTLPIVSFAWRFDAGELVATNHPPSAGRLGVAWDFDESPAAVLGF